jgi:hypothetical protein
MIKAGAQRFAAQHGIMLVAPRFQRNDGLVLGHFYPLSDQFVLALVI